MGRWIVHVLPNSAQATKMKIIKRRLKHPNAAKIKTTIRIESTKNNKYYTKTSIGKQDKTTNGGNINICIN